MAHEGNILEQLAEVPATQHRRRDWIAWAQVWLPLCALAATGLFWLGEWFDRGDVRYTPGRLAHVHATWDERCSACHVTAQPLSGRNWSHSLLAHEHAADVQCQTCHAGPPHHANENADEVAGCTTCHHEHRGRKADLRRVASEQCTRCHAALAQHVKAGATNSFADVASFLGERHPEFRWLRDKTKDPGKLAFNHKLHLADGLRDQPAINATLTLAEIPLEFRERYRKEGQSDQDRVQLDCAACHRADGDAPRAAGDYMLPISYEKHCQACHPLQFAAKDINRPHAEQPKVPHHLQPGEVHAWLRGYFTERSLKDQQPFLQQPLRPLPGKSARTDPSAKKVGDILASQVEAAERILFGPSTCGKCHTTLDAGLGPKQRVEPLGVPAVWFTHARFDHTAHRGVACAVCHANVEGSRIQADVLLPGVRICQSCHAPAGASGDRVVGGARHDCVECHRYHGGDDPLHGRGTAPRRAPGGVAPDVQPFLQGAWKN